MDTIQDLWSQLFSSRPPPALYEQILLFGDSITEFAEKQELGFAFAAALRAGECHTILHTRHSGFIDKCIISLDRTSDICL
jgi:hypothetical protein